MVLNIAAYNNIHLMLLEINFLAFLTFLKTFLTSNWIECTVMDACHSLHPLESSVFGV